MRYSPFLALAGLLALAACNQSSTETVNDTIVDPMEDQLKNAPVAELPPPLKESATYRCKDNSLIFVDFFQGDTQANLRTAKDKPPVRLKAENAGNPFVSADGAQKLEGSGKAITYNGQSCKA